MPIDINRLRKERGGDPESVKSDQKKRFASESLVDTVMKLDAEWRAEQSQWESVKMEINRLQTEISRCYKTKQPVDETLKQQRKRLVETDEPTQRLRAEELKRQVESQLNKIANWVHPNVPISNNEDDNVVISVYGTKTPNPKDAEGNGTLMFHHEVLHRVDGYEPEKGVGVAGHRAYFLKGVGVMLNQALIMYGQTFLNNRDYTLLQPPYFMNKDAMSAVAQLDDFDEQLYKVSGEGGEEKYLIATSEQPMCGFHKGEWLQESTLPLKYGGTSTCFRKEAGSHGKDTWGIFRVHQFDKIEQFVICAPEQSEDLHKEMLSTAEAFYESLGLSYRVVNIVSGELNNAAAQKYDLEAWFPAYEEYRELVSASNCTDYQSRGMEIRCGVKKMNQNEKKYVHMLNSTLCATTRTICCILENYQTPTGVTVPSVLVPFMGGMTFLPYKKEKPVNLTQKKMKKAAAKPKH